MYTITRHMFTSLTSDRKFVCIGRA